MIENFLKYMTNLFDCLLVSSLNKICCMWNKLVLLFYSLTTESDLFEKLGWPLKGRGFFLVSLVFLLFFFLVFFFWFQLSSLTVFSSYSFF